MKNYIKRVKATYTLENVRYMYSVRPVATVLALIGDALIMVAVAGSIVAIVVFGIGITI